jgi:ABC-type amino acid transport substrate-binding protein
VSDLAGGIVAVREGTSSQSFMEENYPEAELRLVDPFSAASLLRSGEVDGWVTGSNDTDEFANFEIGTLPTAFPVDPAQPGLVEDMDKALADMIAGGTYGEIYERWFGTPDSRVDIP